MRAFIAALIVMAVIAVGSFVMLQQVQKPASVAFATAGARVDAID